MKSRMASGLVVLFLCSSVFAQKPKDLPKIFTVAQFVFVETQYGPVDTTVMDSRVTNEDRAAVANLEKAIHSWGRYQLTAQPSEADLIFVVRPGRLASVNVGIRTSRSSSQPGQPVQRGNNSGLDLGGEVGQPQDILAVYVKNPDGSLGIPLWQQVLDHGLDSPGMTLLKKFRDEVDAASARATNPPKQTP